LPSRLPSRILRRKRRRLPIHEASTLMPRAHPGTELRGPVVVDGQSLATEHGQKWAEALGAELVINSGRREPARVEAQLSVVEANAGHIRWRVRHSKSPLLIARPPSRMGRILVAVELGDSDEGLLQLVARLARRQNSEVTLLHTVEPGLHEAEWMANFGGSG